MKIKDVLNEGLSPVLFHATSLKGFDGMMRSNEIKLSRDSAARNRYYMSFSRNKANGFIPYLLSLGNEAEEEAFDPRNDAFVVVEFSGVSLGQNYSGAAFNTFHDPDEPDETDHTAPDFMEDRLYNNKPIIPNAKKYIVGLSLITNGKKVNDKAIVQFIERYGNKFKFYESTKSYTANKQKSS